MFLRIALFEIRFWLRSWMVWIFLFIIGLLIFGAVSTDQVQVGNSLVQHVPQRALCHPELLFVHWAAHAADVHGICHLSRHS